MFTGIIQDIGTVTDVDRKGERLITIETQLGLNDLSIGASIACNGICVTVIEKDATHFKAQFSDETLSKTTAVHWQPGLKLNLERALRVGDELGGHYVSGHVDTIALLILKQLDGESIRLHFEVPELFSKFIAPKGSVTLDGISLTVNDVAGTRFGVNLIPHTLKATTLGDCAIGSEVNCEIDTIARYVERMMSARAAP